MSRKNTQVDNTEYYLEVDNTTLKVNLMKYVFNTFHPNGKEHLLCSISYAKKAGYTYREALDFIGGLVDMLNNTSWEDENNVY